MNRNATSMAMLSSGLVRAWVRFYTAGLPLEIKATRRGEIESDLWEHQSDAKAIGGKPREVAVQVFVRWLSGIPADLLWRCEQLTSEQKAGKRGERRFTMGASLVGKAWLGVAVIMALVAIALGVENGVSTAEDRWMIEHGGRSLWVIIPVILAVAIVGGLGLSLKSRLLGGGLVAVGAAGFGVLFAWYIFPPVLAVLTIALWIMALRSGTATRS